MHESRDRVEKKSLLKKEKKIFKVLNSVEYSEIYSHVENKVYFVKTTYSVIYYFALISRNFCKNIMRVNFWNFHTVSAESWLLKSDLKICEIGLNVLNRMKKEKLWFSGEN